MQELCLTGNPISTNPSEHKDIEINFRVFPYFLLQQNTKTLPTFTVLTLTNIPTMTHQNINQMSNTNSFLPIISYQKNYQSQCTMQQNQPFQKAINFTELHCIYLFPIPSPHEEQ